MKWIESRFSNDVSSIISNFQPTQPSCPSICFLHSLPLTRTEGKLTFPWSQVKGDIDLGPAGHAPYWNSAHWKRWTPWWPAHRVPFWPIGASAAAWRSSTPLNQYRASLSLLLNKRQGRPPSFDVFSLCIFLDMDLPERDIFDLKD